MQSRDCARALCVASKGLPSGDNPTRVSRSRFADHLGRLRVSRPPGCAALFKAQRGRGCAGGGERRRRNHREARLMIRRNQYSARGCVGLIRPPTTLEPEGWEFQSLRARHKRAGAGKSQPGRPGHRLPRCATEDLSAPALRITLIALPVDIRRRSGRSLSRGPSVGRGRSAISPCTPNRGGPTFGPRRAECAISQRIGRGHSRVARARNSWSGCDPSSPWSSR